MSRYIDAELLEPDTEWDNYDDRYVSYSQLAIDSAPTADVVEVVRCKYCKHSVESLDGMVYCHISEFRESINHYCGYGDLKDELRK